MCEQCLTDMLNVYSEEKNDAYLYIGISRRDHPDVEDYPNDYELGDVMVGKTNGPDIVIRHDLFTTEDLVYVDEVIDTEDEEAASRFNTRQKVVANYYDLDPFWDEYVETHWTSAIYATLHVNRHFGLGKEHESWWPKHVTARIGDIFQEFGIPLSKASRGEWARQFHAKVDHVAFESNDPLKYRLTYPVFSKEGDYLRDEDLLWDTRDDLPSELKGYHDFRLDIRENG